MRFDFEDSLLKVKLLRGSSWHILRLKVLIILSLLDKPVAILENLLKVLFACLNNGLDGFLLKFETLALWNRVNEFFEIGLWNERHWLFCRLLVLKIFDDRLSFFLGLSLLSSWVDLVFLGWNFSFGRNSLFFLVSFWHLIWNFIWICKLFGLYKVK